MKQRFGNLVKEAEHGLFDVIAHGCNCHNTMGAGIALTIRKQWPAAYAADSIASSEGKVKLGTFSFADVQTLEGNNLRILNCYTQFDTGGYRPADYEAIAKNFEAIAVMYGKSGAKVGLPLIGCGLAGGSWKIVKAMIEEILSEVDVTVIHFPENNYLQQVVIRGEITVKDGEVFYAYEGDVFKSTEEGLEIVPLEGDVIETEIEYLADDNFYFRIHNRSNKTVKVLRWYTPLEGMRSDCVTVIDPFQEQLKYEGIMAKRGLPTEEDYLVLDPNTEVTEPFALQDGYKLLAGVEYEVSFKKSIMFDNDMRTQGLTPEYKTNTVTVSETKPTKGEHLRSRV